MQTDAKWKFDWSGRLEQLEERLLMSADPIGGFLGGAIEQHAILDEPPLLDQHVESAPDFWIDPSDEAALNDELYQIDQALEDAHSLTGLLDVRNDYGFTGIGQTVAVIDSGIAYDHFALGGGLGSNYRVVGGWDFTGENDADPYDDGPSGSHGTHVSGIVGGDSVNDSGVAPGVDLVGLRVFDDAGAGYFSWVESALSWVHANRNSFENPITAINLSLGVSGWNSDTIPAWAMLEDEFAQLEADGIFIAVSAGNSFTSYNTTGLSYPASSSYVIPVMSTDDSGLMSYFSQRHSRAIAAPGRSITSTVPDYAGNNNGITDDYASYSGTSMASPYVAGASVIVREAMQFAGYTNITQDTIYNHMIATADSFFDSATSQSYSRLNVQSAIDALMPADDFGSTLATAYGLGTVSNPMAMSGAVGTLNDVDYFNFTAANTGTVTFTASNMTHELGAAWSVTGGTATMSGAANDIYAVDVIAGQTYTVGFSSDNGIGYYDFDITAESSFTFTDWGTVDFNQLAGVVIGGDSWYRVQASQAGYITVDGAFDAGGGQISLELYDSSLQLIDTGNAVGGTSRVDTYAAMGDELFVKVLGTNSDVDFRLTNLVSLNGTTVDVAGTVGDDTFAFTAGTTHQAIVNGVAYDFASISITDVNYNGGAGIDSITMTGTAGDETARLRVGNATLTGVGFATSALGVENVTVNSGSGTDRAVLYDSSGNDLFYSDSTSAYLSGTGFLSVVNGFDNVKAHSTLGGVDQAQLHGSSGDDYFKSTEQYSFLRSWEIGRYTQVNGFDQVDAYAGAGGYDRVHIYDSAGNDVFTASQQTQTASMVGANFTNSAHNFQTINAHATAGGTDWAHLSDSVGNDYFYSSASNAHLSGANFYFGVDGFDTVKAYSTAGGVDRAELHGSTGDDYFKSTEQYGFLRSWEIGRYTQADGFDQVDAYAGAGGYDRVHIYDSAGNDVFTASQQTQTASMVGANFTNSAHNFQTINAHATAGGTDWAHLFDSAGNDYLYSGVANSYLSGTGFYYGVDGFDSIKAYSTAGGADQAELHGSTGDDYFKATDQYTFMRSLQVGRYTQADGFDQVNAYAGVGGYDHVHMYDSIGDDLFAVGEQTASITGANFANRAHGFNNLYAHSTLGGTDTTDASAYDYVYGLLGDWV